MTEQVSECHNRIQDGGGGPVHPHSPIPVHPVKNRSAYIQNYKHAGKQLGCIHSETSSFLDIAPYFNERRY